MASTVSESGISADAQATVREVLDSVRADGRDALSAPEAKRVADAYGIPVPQEGLATSAEEAVRLAEDMGFPVVLKIVSPDILHKTEAKGVLVGIDSADEASRGFDTIVANAKAYKADASITGVQVQQMLPSGAVEVLIGAVTDPTFGKIMTFGLGGVLVEILRDVTFRLAPTSREDAQAMLDGIKTAEVLRGIRGGAGVDQQALISIITNVSQLITDFPEISEVDLNPTLATPEGATAVDARFIVDFTDRSAEQPAKHSREDILKVMNRMMHPRAIAVIGASNEQGKIGNSVMRNLIDGGYAGEIYPVNPKADEVAGKKAYKDISELPDGIDVAVFAIPAKFVVDSIAKVGQKGIAAAVLIPSGFSETGEVQLQEQLVKTARENGVRFIGPNIYGFYYTPEQLCATFCTPYDVKGSVALASQSGGIGMGILGFSRTTKLGVSAIVGVGNKADIDEDDLLTFFEQDDATQAIALHMEDLKDGRAFVEVAKRVSQKKPILVLKAGATPAGSQAAASHTAALAGDDKVYDDILREAGVVRARGLLELLNFARAVPVLPTPQGENVIIITGAGGSGVLLSDACFNNGLSLMDIPQDLNDKFFEYIPPFGAAGNPVDITGGEPPSTYRNTIALGLEDDRVHSIVLGYWHTIVTPPMTFAKVVSEVVAEYRAKGIEKPIVASLAGDVEVEEASEYLFHNGVPAYPYTTETPVEVLGAKYRWARQAGLLNGKTS
jgi:acetyl coenzyme A synthetase (ADP forming)-like protein